MSANLAVLKWRTFIILTLLSFSLTLEAAEHYVRSGATGLNNGTDWTNAYTSLPPALIRGDTYYIAGGTYTGRTFDTPASSTLLISIKGATQAEHGSNTGWSSDYSVEVSQAVWTSNVTFNTSYWVFDGSVGPKWSKDPSQYGFKFNPVFFPISIYNTISPISDIKVSHIAAKSPSGDVNSDFISTDNSTKSVHNVTISYCLTDGWTNAVWATSDGLAMNNWIIEYNVILNGYSSANYHGEDINNNYGYFDNLAIRYNWFEGRRTGTGCIVVLNGPAGAYHIYGNVFKSMRGGDGIITGVHYPLSGEVYNNTFIDVDNGYNNGLWIGHDVSSKVYNNLIYNSVAGIGGNFTGFNDYNAYFNTSNTPMEAHGQIGIGSPFVNEPLNDLRLAQATLPGLSLQFPFNTDVYGNLRGNDGVWDRGALELNGSSTVALLAPLNLRVIK